MTPLSKAEPGAGAMECASANQKWRGAIAALAMKPNATSVTITWLLRSRPRLNIGTVIALPRPARASSVIKPTSAGIMEIAKYLRPARQALVSLPIRASYTITKKPMASASNQNSTNSSR